MYSFIVNKSKVKIDWVIPSTSECNSLFLWLVCLLISPFFYFYVFILGLEMDSMSLSTSIVVILISCSNVYVFFIVGLNRVYSNKNNFWKLLNDFIVWTMSKNPYDLVFTIVKLICLFLCIVLITSAALSIIILYLGLSKAPLTVISWWWLRFSILPFIIYIINLFVSAFSNILNKKNTIQYSIFSINMFKCLTWQRLLLFTSSVSLFFLVKPLFIPYLGRESLNNLNLFTVKDISLESANPYSLDVGRTNINNMDLEFKLGKNSCKHNIFTTIFGKSYVPSMFQNNTLPKIIPSYYSSKIQLMVYYTGISPETAIMISCEYISKALVIIDYNQGSLLNKVNLSCDTVMVRADIIAQTSKVKGVSCKIPNENPDFMDLIFNNKNNDNKITNGIIDNTNKSILAFTGRSVPDALDNIPAKDDTKKFIKVIYNQGDISQYSTIEEAYSRLGPALSEDTFRLFLYEDPYYIIFPKYKIYNNAFVNLLPDPVKENSLINSPEAKAVNNNNFKTVVVRDNWTNTISYKTSAKTAADDISDLWYSELFKALKDFRTFTTPNKRLTVTYLEDEGKLPSEIDIDTEATPILITNEATKVTRRYSSIRQAKSKLSWLKGRDPASFLKKQDSCKIAKHIVSYAPLIYEVPYFPKCSTLEMHASNWNNTWNTVERSEAEKLEAARVEAVRARGEKAWVKKLKAKKIEAQKLEAARIKSTLARIPRLSLTASDWTEVDASMEAARKDLIARGLKANYFNVKTLAVEWLEEKKARVETERFEAERLTQVDNNVDIIIYPYNTGNN
nr:hypothetical protein KMAF15_00011 [Varicosporium sp.]